MRQRISAIILNYKRPEDTLKCLSHLHACDFGKQVDYYIVDNSPEDKFPAIPSGVRYLLSSRNLGFAGGNNLAIRRILKTKAKYILIINPDVVVGKKFFKPLLTVFDNDAKVGIVAPAIRHKQKGVTFFGLDGKVDWRTGKATHTNLRRLAKNLKTKPSEFVTFACVLINTEVFRKTGLLDERFFMYLEDVDFCLRTRRADFHIFIDPGVIVDHKTSSSFKRPTDKLLISFFSQLKFIDKWLRFPQNIFPYLYTILFYPYLYALWTYHFYKRGFFGQVDE